MAKKTNFIVRVYRFYLEGFRSMTIGKTLWIIILIKLFIMFAVLRIFFFKPALSGLDKVEKEEVVGEKLIKRAVQ